MPTAGVTIGFYLEYIPLFLFPNRILICLSFYLSPMKPRCSKECSPFPISDRLYCHAHHNNWEQHLRSKPISTWKSPNHRDCFKNRYVTQLESYEEETAPGFGEIHFSSFNSDPVEKPRSSPGGVVCSTTAIFHQKASLGDMQKGTAERTAPKQS